jgi:serine phosphatase RsbU (regulator of sigma subunit)
MHKFLGFVFSLLIAISFAESQNLYSPLEIDSLERVSRVYRKDTSLLELNLELSKHFYNKNLMKSRMYAGKAFQLSKELKSLDGQADALFQLALINHRVGKLSEALDFVNQAARLYELTGDAKANGMVKAELGNLYASMGNMVKAIESHQEAIDIFEGIKFNQGVAQCYSDLGNTHFYQKNYQTALRYFKKSKEIFEQEKDLKAVAELYNRISSVYRDMGELSKSIDYDYYALMIQEKLRDKSGIAQSNLNIGQTAILQGELKRAEGYIEYASKLYKEIGDQLGLTRCLLISAEIEVKQGALENASDQLKQCIEIAKESGAQKELSTAYSTISKVYEEKKLFEQAYKFMTLHAQLKDTLYSKDKMRMFSEMEVKYRTKNKEKELQKEKQKTQEQSGKTVMYVSFALSFSGLLVVIILLMLKRSKLRKQINEDLSIKNDLIRNKNQEIIDSIYYAKKIQEAIITPKSYFDKIFRNHFIFFKPKDIVSGDFYWAYHDPVKNKSFWVTADCTGHGVPGALMSMIGTVMLNEIVIVGKTQDPESILKKLSKYLKRYINNDEEDISRDGIELSLCVLDRDNDVLQYCGANGNAFLVREDGVVIDLKGSKQPIGYDPLERGNTEFEVIEQKIQENDLVVTFTDGYPDQIGVENRKKFKVGALKKNMIEWRREPMETIQNNLVQALEEWQGEIDQIDDILVIAVKL